MGMLSSFSYKKQARNITLQKRKKLKGIVIPCIFRDFYIVY